jgi:hypothetical protein
MVARRSSALPSAHCFNLSRRARAQAHTPFHAPSPRLFAPSSSPVSTTCIWARRSISRCHACGGVCPSIISLRSTSPPRFGPTSLFPGQAVGLVNGRLWPTGVGCLRTETTKHCLVVCRFNSAFILRLLKLTGRPAESPKCKPAGSPSTPAHPVSAPARIESTTST